MRFVVPDHVLVALRQRRDEQRARRVGRAPRTPTSLVATVRGLFGHKDVNAAADAYVSGMDALQDEVECEHDAFLLDPGMGPMSYLTADGRVLLDFRSFDGDEVREADDNEAIATLVVGARKTGITALLELVPAMPAGGVACSQCAGTRWLPMLPTVICLHCYGRGWQPAPTT